MSSSKSYFLGVLGIPETSSTLTHDLKLKRQNETVPFGELITRKDGKVVLRIGDAFEDGIITVVK